LALGKVDEGKQSMSKLVYSEEEIDGMKKDFERIDKIYSEALDLSNKKSYKSAIKTINQGLETSSQCSIL
jgi:hypothetical protein